MNDQQPVRALTDAEVFAALTALPERFRFEVSRRTRREPDPDLATMEAPRLVGESPALTKAAYAARERALMASMRERVTWSIMLTMNDHGFTFVGEGPTLDGAWSLVRMQITAFTEIL